MSVMVFAVYGSLIPFELQYVPLKHAWEQFQILLFAPSSRRISRTNFLANVLLFIPMGFGLMGMLLADRGRRLLVVPAAFAVMSLSLTLSLIVEFLQIFATARVPSRVDVAAQSIGCVIGIAAWLVAGPALTSWLRAASDQRRGDRLARALAAYAAAWAFVNLAPFDITLDAGDLARRVRNGLITLVPFGSGLAGWRIAWDVFATTVSAVPLGVLGLAAGASPGRAAGRGAVAAFGYGIVLVVGMELLQIFIRSHAADAGDVISGSIGVALGVWAGTRILSRSTEPDNAALAREGRGWAALAAWCLVVCAYHWMPYDFALDPVAIERKLAAISLLPFAGYWSGSYINAFNDLLVKLGLSMPLGLAAAFALHRRGGPSTGSMIAAVAGAALLFAGVETGQLFVPSRTPEPTDVLIGTAGAGLGLWLGDWLMGGPWSVVRGP